MASAHLMPSMAADMIPPAYPAPSPQGYSPFRADCFPSSRKMRLLIDPEEESDGISKVKTCKAYSLEYEFAKKTIFLEAGTFNFYNGIDVSDENTIVGRIHECLPDWRFNIDESLIGRYRTFDDVSKKVYEFIKSDVQEKYRCIFDFDTYNRMITVRDVDAVVPTNQLTFEVIKIF